MLALRVQYYFVNAVLVLVRVCTMITVVHAYRLTIILFFNQEHQNLSTIAAAQAP